MLTAHCEPCYLQLLQNEVKQLLNYQNAKIYVRKIKYDDIHDPSGDAEDDKFDETFTDVSITFSLAFIKKFSNNFFFH